MTQKKSETKKSSLTNAELQKKLAASLDVQEEFEKKIANMQAQLAEVKESTQVRTMDSKTQFPITKMKGDSKEEIDKMIKALQVLKRVKITTNDPRDKSLTAVNLKFGNSYVNLHKAVSVNSDKAWHIPVGILKNLEAKSYQQYFTSKVNGEDEKRSRQAPAYNIQILPDLTEEELKDLAKKQKVSNSIPD